MKCDKLKDYSIIDIEAIDDERYKKEKAPGKFVPESRVYLKSEVDTAIAELKRENRKLKRALWVARAASAKFWANYWFDVAPSKYIKYDRIGRMEGVEKEFILTNVNKHMTASDWVGLWEKVEQRCKKKAEDYK